VPSGRFQRFMRAFPGRCRHASGRRPTFDSLRARGAFSKAGQGLAPVRAADKNVRCLRRAHPRSDRAARRPPTRNRRLSLQERSSARDALATVVDPPRGLAGVAAVIGENWAPVARLSERATARTDYRSLRIPSKGVTKTRNPNGALYLLPRLG